MLQLRLFGTGQAQYLDQVFPSFPQQQPYYLLCYLILNRYQPQNRERLAAVFWSDYPTAISRKYLRDALWRLRHIFITAGAPLAMYLTITDNSVAFVNSAPYWLDVEIFEDTMKRCQDISGTDM